MVRATNRLSLNQQKQIYHIINKINTMKLRVTLGIIRFWLFSFHSTTNCCLYLYAIVNVISFEVKSVENGIFTSRKTSHEINLLDEDFLLDVATFTNEIGVIVDIWQWVKPIKKKGI